MTLTANDNSNVIIFPSLLIALKITIDALMDGICLLFVDWSDGIKVGLPG